MHGRIQAIAKFFPEGTRMLYVCDISWEYTSLENVHLEIGCLYLISSGLRYAAYAPRFVTAICFGLYPFD